MLQSLKTGSILHDVYRIDGVLGIGGNSIVYQAYHETIGPLLIKEHVYANFEIPDWNRNEQGDIAAEAKDRKFEKWQKKNRLYALHENEQLLELRKNGYIFYDCKMDFFAQHNTYYTCFLNMRGHILKDCEIKDAADLYHKTLGILRALIQFHDLGFLHLDIASDNILMTELNTAYLLDFGSVKHVGEVDHRHLTSKDKYTSPEVKERMNYPFEKNYQGKINYTSDIYSVGVLMMELYDCCCEKKGYAKEYETYCQAAQKAMEEKQKDRYQSLKELYDVLEKEYHAILFSKLSSSITILDASERLKEEIENKKYNQNAYYYRNRNAYFVGRKQEKEALEVFQDRKEPILFKSISAEGGSGKSSLMYSFIEDHLYDVSGWKYAYVKADELIKLDMCELTHIGFPIMLIIDYILKGSIEEIAQFLEKAANTQGSYKVRIVFIERSYEERAYPIWIEQMKPYGSFDQIMSIYDGDMRLPMLSDPELSLLIQQFSGVDEHHAAIVISRLEEMDALKRPLYAMMLSEAMKQEGSEERSSWDKENVLSYIVEREERRIKEIAKEDHEEILKQYVMATMVQTLDYNHLHDIDDSFSIKRNTKEIIDQINGNDQGWILHGLQPDIAGEYLILHYLHTLPDYLIRDLLNVLWEYDGKALALTLMRIEDDFEDPLQNMKVLYAAPKYMKAGSESYEGYHDLLSYLLRSARLKEEVQERYQQCYAYYIKDGVWKEYNGKDTNLILPDTIETIGRITGIHAKDIETIHFSNQVKEIAKQAFFYHPSLKEIYLSSSIKEISDKAFYKCAQLKKVHFLTGLETIGAHSFAFSGLEEVHLPEGLEEIKDYAFYGCKSITNTLWISDGVKKIGKGAFADSGKKITSLHLPKTLEVIQAYAFSYVGTCFCDLYLPEGLQHLEEDAFSHTRLSHVSIPSSIHVIKEGCFTNAMIQKLTLSEGLEEIGFAAFSHNEFEEVLCPSSLRVVEDNAFAACPNLRKLLLREGIHTMGNIFGIETMDETNANTHVDEFIIPASLLHVGLPITAKRLIIKAGSHVFQTDTLGEYYFDPANLVNGFKQKLQLNNKKDIIMKKKDYYTFDMDDIWKKTRSALRQIKETEEALRILDTYEPDHERKKQRSNRNDDQECENMILTKRRIEDSAYEGCEKLKEVYFDEGVEEIGEKAFADCGITALSLPASIQTIEYGAFAGCEDLKEVHLPQSLKSIRMYTFCGCIALENIDIPASVDYIGVQAFSYCSSLKQVEFHEGVKQIDQNAFSQCALHLLKLPSTLEVLGAGAFSSCQSLKKVELSDHLRHIGNGAFSGCCLQQLILPEGLETIGSCAFANTKIKALHIPSSLRDLWGNTFDEMEELEQLSFYYHSIDRRKIPIANDWSGLHHLKHLEVIYDEPFQYYETMNVYCEQRKYPMTFQERSIAFTGEDLDVGMLLAEFCTPAFIQMILEDMES